MTETIRATSITVTAMASTRVPKGSPVRCATTSAWYTAAKTVAIRAAPATAAITPPVPSQGASNKIAQANSGQAHAHHGVLAGCFPDAILHEPYVQIAPNRGGFHAEFSGFG